MKAGFRNRDIRARLVALILLTGVSNGVANAGSITYWGTIESADRLDLLPASVFHPAVGDSFTVRIDFDLAAEPPGVTMPIAPPIGGTVTEYSFPVDSSPPAATVTIGDQVIDNTWFAAEVDVTDDIGVIDDVTTPTIVDIWDAWSVTLRASPELEPWITLLLTDEDALAGDAGNFFIVDDMAGFEHARFSYYAVDPSTSDLVTVLAGSIYAVQRFVDVPPDYWAFGFVQRLAAAGISNGCNAQGYCPDERVTRAQMAVFLERAMRGSAFIPPTGSGSVFSDVAAGDFAAAFIEQLYLDGITGGCGGTEYCPAASVSRAQMAVFLLRAMYGRTYMPPTPSGAFGDVDLSHWAAAWIEQLAAEGITTGCGGGDYCPDADVTRAQMGVFLVRAFGL